MPAPVQDVIWVKAREAGKLVDQLTEADVYGDLAVHEGIGRDRGWTVTHVPTGQSIHKGLTRLQATSLVEELVKVNWASTDRSLLSQRNSQAARAAFGKVLGEK
jgi:hypothetical protein